MATKKWVVRVVQFTLEVNGNFKADRDALSDLWLEQLRYAGVIQWITRDEEIQDPLNSEKTALKNVFDIYDPLGGDSKMWAKRVAERMKSFGLNAVAAPEWEE